MRSRAWQYTKRYWVPATLGGVGVTLFTLGLPDSGWFSQDIARGLVIVGAMLILLCIILSIRTARGVHRVILPKAKAKRIGVAEKNKVTALMDTVNNLENMMNQFFNKALYHKGDRVMEYQSLLDSLDFSNLWGSHLSQRAIISVISPELEDRVRLLLSLIQGCHKNTLSKQYTDQLPELSRQLEEQAMAIETIRKGIKQTIEKLIG